MSRLREGLVRVGAVLLFGALFFGVWQPLRSALAVHGLAPLLAALTGAPVVGVADPPSVAAPGTPHGYAVPAGLHLLVPGLFLAALAPRRPYVLVLLAVLLALGALALGAYALGLSGWRAGFTVQAFLQNYVVPPASAGLPLYLLLGRGALGRGERIRPVRPAPGSGGEVPVTSGPRDPRP